MTHQNTETLKQWFAEQVEFEKSTVEYWQELATIARGEVVALQARVAELEAENKTLEAKITVLEEEHNVMQSRYVGMKAVARRLLGPAAPDELQVGYSDGCFGTISEAVETAVGGFKDRVKKLEALGRDLAGLWEDDHVHEDMHGFVAVAKPEALKIMERARVLLGEGLGRQAVSEKPVETAERERDEAKGDRHEIRTTKRH
jgi:cell division protein FtsB